MKTLQRALQAAFSPGRSYPHRLARETSKRLAAEHGITVEKLPGGGMNVWPPAECPLDPFDGDHYAQDWAEAVERVRAYAASAKR
jgi:hypothetical protein